MYINSHRDYFSRLTCSIQSHLILFVTKAGEIQKSETQFAQSNKSSALSTNAHPVMHSLLFTSAYMQQKNVHNEQNDRSYPSKCMKLNRGETVLLDETASKSNHY